MSARKPPGPNLSALPAADVLPLTKAEQAMLKSFRATDNRGREDIAEIALAIAELNPGVPRPVLRLVGFSK